MTGIAVLLLAATAAVIHVGAELDRLSAAVLEPVRLTITVVTEGQAETPSLPHLPEMASFEVRAGSRSTSVSLVGGKVRTEYRFTYLLIPKEDGVLPIPPATVKVGDVEYRTQELLLSVRAPGEPGAEEPELLPPPTIFAKARLSAEEVWLGEQVNYFFELYTISGDISAQLTPPQFDGFLARSLPDGRVRYEEVEGRTYLVRTLGTALFPVRTGRLTVPGGVASYRMNLLGPRLSVAADPVSVEVRPLPPGAPPGFSGAVGSFTVRAELSAAEVRVGEAATLRVEVSGWGDLSAAGPPVPAVEGEGASDWSAIAGLAITPAGSQCTGGFQDDRFRSRRVWEYAVLALAEGEIVLPPVEYVFFDPATGAYSQVASGGLRLRALPVPLVSAGSSLPPPKTGEGGRLSRLPWLWEDPLWLALLLVPVLGFFLVPLLRRAAAARAGDPRRRARALAASAQRLAKAGQAEEALALLEQALTLAGGRMDLLERVRRARFSGARGEVTGLAREAAASLARRGRGRIAGLFLAAALAGGGWAAPSTTGPSLTSPGESASILYNLALEKAAAGQAGEAAIFAVRSLALAPRDAEVRRVLGAVVPFGAHVEPLVAVSANEAYALAVAAAWCAFLAAAVGRGRRGLVAAGLVAAALLALVGWRLVLEEVRPAGAVVERAQMSAAPGGGSLAELPPGVLVRVVGMREGWAFVDAGSARRGWIPAEAVRLVWPEEKR